MKTILKMQIETLKAQARLAALLLALFATTASVCAQLSEPPNPGSYSGLGTRGSSGTGRVDRFIGLRNGLLLLMLDKREMFSAQFTVGIVDFSFRGAFNKLNTFDKTFIINSRDVTVHLLGSGDSIDGTIDLGGTTYNVHANRAVFDGKRNPAPMAGKYTMFFQNGKAQATPTPPRRRFGKEGIIPQGYGWATASIKPSGDVLVNGAVADGTKFSVGGSVAQNGDFPFYTSLYDGKGQLAGVLNFTGNQSLRTFEVQISSGDVSGTLAWTKPFQPDNNLFPSPFDIDLEVTGSFYVQPVLSRILASFNNTGGDGDVLFIGGGQGSQDKMINLSRENIVRFTNPSGPSDKLILAFNPLDGTFNGKFSGPGLPMNTPFTGVVLQNQGYGRGFFLGTSSSGQVEINPGQGN